MSGIDADLAPREREALIDEVAAQLPLWLQRAAEPRPQAVDQLVDLLGFTADTLRRVRAVHALLSDRVTRLLAALPAALRSPRPASERPVELAGVVRGPVDWPATARLQAAGLPAMFVVSPRRRVFDTPEHRALAWVLRRLEALCAIALQQAPDGEPRSGSWTAAALHARRLVAHSRRVAWLAALRPERPDHRARTRIRHSRNRFAAGPLSDAIDALIDYESAEGEVLAALIAERYFTPETDWRLFEVVVLIRIDRALAARAGGVRRYLMSDTGVVGRYTLPDGDRIDLRYQGWGGGPSRRADTLVRHGLPVSSSRPDILVERSGAHPDLVVLELKASRNPGTIGDGLSQLLGYLNDRPERLSTQPAGWLVPFPFDALEPLSPDPAEPLWIVPADSVADAIVTRMAPTL
jgi:hypothetical protein